MHGRRSERWYTTECKEVKAETRRLERIYRSTHITAAHIQWRQLFNTQRLVFQRVYAEYWRTVIDNCLDIHTLWRIVGGLLHPVSTRVDPLSADSFKVLFTGKVDAVRAMTEPSITVREVPPLDLYHEGTSDEIYFMIRTTLNKHCAQDPAPTWVIKQLADVLASVITNMVNMSFNQGHFSKAQKHAIVGPRIKKPSLDQTDLMFYRPVSNITFILKLIERIALNRFSVHSGLFKLLPARQSAYRRFHSTKTAVAIVHNDIVRATDAGQITALVLLDLSAALDTMNHGILLDELSSSLVSRIESLNGSLST